MTIQRQNPGDISLSVSVYRDGELLTDDQDKYDIKEFVRAFEIYESISSATIEAYLTVEDSGGVIGAFTGSELFKINIKGSVLDRTFYMRCYQIRARSRSNQSNDVYILDLASDEFVKNEAVNIFGNTEVIFKDNTESSKIIEKILKDKRYIGTRKNVYLEETLNKHLFVVPNWRPFDTIYWMCHRSIRKKKSGGIFQNGFAFFESALGYHFKSIDKMIEDINDMDDEDTDPNTGKTKLYRYEYIPKQIGSGADDQFKITSVVFPTERNFLSGLRHGTWSGFSIGFDPNTTTSSKMGESTDMSVDAYRYKLVDLWDKMSHIEGGNNKNPIKEFDSTVQELVNFPKRVRYSILPNQIFDPKYQNNPQKNYEALVELQAYEWMRMESLKAVKLKIQIPGNLDLYAGSGIDVIMPASFKEGTTTKLDKRYSGRYVIVSLTHKSTGTGMQTELLLMKDSTL